MLWHEIVCDKCLRQADGYAGIENDNDKIMEKARADGWIVLPNGEATCPDCQ
jgi:hypothetical protein